MKFKTRTPQRRHEIGVCICGKSVACRVPAGGDGSELVTYPHKHYGERCPGSRRRPKRMETT